MTDQPPPPQLDVRAVAQLLHLPVVFVWALVLSRQLPVEHWEHRRPRWTAEHIYHWAAAQPTTMRMQARLPITHWPRHGTFLLAQESGALTLPADYLGPLDVDGGVATIWRTVYGVLAIVWPLPHQPQTSLRAHADHLGHHHGVQAVVIPAGDFGRAGPALFAMCPAVPDSKYEPSWTDLTDVIGGPVPYWPADLRDRDLLHEWTPQTPPPTVAATPAIDTTALLRLAATYDSDHPAARVLVTIARLAQARATDSAKFLAALATKNTTELHLTIAAHALHVPEARLDDLDPVQRRAGWLDILARTDRLAATCVREAMKWDGGVDFPFGNCDLIDLDTEPALEWAHRLQPTPRTAAFELLNSSTDEGMILTDPATDAPAVRNHSQVTAAIPQRIPTTSPLAEVILSGPIWIRTADGTIYPAPRHSYYGLGWGYPGSGPGTLALTIHRLLDDITAPGGDDINGAPEGLEALTEVKWPKGTVLTRDLLEQARHGRWQPPPEDPGDH